VTYELTGPDPVSWDDLAALASSISGKNVRYQPVDDREYREHVTALGVPEAAIGMLLSYYGAVRSGWAARPRLTWHSSCTGHRPAQSRPSATQPRPSAAAGQVRPVGLIAGVAR
jgi:hypothetical protein